MSVHFLFFDDASPYNTYRKLNVIFWVTGLSSQKCVTSRACSMQKDTKHQRRKSFLGSKLSFILLEESLLGTENSFETYSLFSGLKDHLELNERAACLFGIQDQV